MIISYIACSDRFQVGIPSVIILESNKQPSILLGKSRIKFLAPGVQIGETEIRRPIVLFFQIGVDSLLVFQLYRIEC